MDTDKHRFKIALFLLLSAYFSLLTVSGQTIKITDYYPIADGNEWRYTAPPGWKDGDYVSAMRGEGGGGHGFPQRLVVQQPLKDGTPALSGDIIKHFDATKAAKILAYVEGRGIYYLREEFANNDGSAEFDRSILWFPETLKSARLKPSRRASPENSKTVAPVAAPINLPRRFRISRMSPSPPGFSKKFYALKLSRSGISAMAVRRRPSAFTTMQKVSAS